MFLRAINETKQMCGSVIANSTLIIGPHEHILHVILSAHSEHMYVLVETFRFLNQKMCFRIKILTPKNPSSICVIWLWLMVIVLWLPK